MFTQGILNASTDQRVFGGPVDDPFFVDLGGIFDHGNSQRQDGPNRDAIACLNVSILAIQVPISTLQKDNKTVDQAANILDPDFVIDVWASASRQRIRTLVAPNQQLKYGVEKAIGGWQQVSRLGMPLTNEAVIPVGRKNYWNSLTPYNKAASNNTYFYNPELALYMDDAQFGGAVPAFAQLRIQKNSLGAFNFGNGGDGLYPLKGSIGCSGDSIGRIGFQEDLFALYAVWGKNEEAAEAYKGVIEMFEDGAAHGHVVDLDYGKILFELAGDDALRWRKCLLNITRDLTILM